MVKLETIICKCGNSKLGLECVCSWLKRYPGENIYKCKFCGDYKAAVPRCTACEEKE